MHIRSRRSTLHQGEGERDVPGVLTCMHNDNGELLHAMKVVTCICWWLAYSVLLIADHSHCTAIRTTQWLAYGAKLQQRQSVRTCLILFDLLL